MASAFEAVWRGVLVSMLLLCGASFLPAEARPREVNVKFGLPAGTIVIVDRERRLLLRVGRRQGATIQRRGRQTQRALGRADVRFDEAGKSLLDAGRWRADGAWRHPEQSARQAGALSRLVAAAHSWHAVARVDRQRGVNGCIRMLNEDVIDLYERVHLGAPVVAVNKADEVGRFKEPVVSGKLSAR